MDPLRMNRGGQSGHHQLFLGGKALEDGGLGNPDTIGNDRRGNLGTVFQKALPGPPDHFFVRNLFSTSHDDLG
jgi:hypothetical protein